MKKIIALLGSLSLIFSGSTWVSSCSPIKIGHEGCFDEKWKNRTDKDSDSDQWIDIFTINLCLLMLSKNIFSNSESFYQMNGKTANELVEDYFRDPSGNKFEDDSQFKYDFIFLITNYESINIDVIEQMKQDLQTKEEGIYLFLNLPLNQRDADIQIEPRIDFQFVFLIKNSADEIINNKNNNWFYWYDQDNINLFDSSSNEQKYFFDFFIYAAYQRVVTETIPL